ncbi:MAG: DUF1653 domain-containing protein [Treponemataceae bacterium]|nr:DUF1653 domain-containing protein [Treponemataceae bacterium]
MNNDKVKINRIYRHFKGDLYLVQDIGYDCETGGELVIYRSLYGEGKLWVRPIESFLSEVDRAKYPDVAQKYRFELVDKKSVRE